MADTFPVTLRDSHGYEVTTTSAVEKYRLLAQGYSEVVPADAEADAEAEDAAEFAAALKAVASSGEKGAAALKDAVDAVRKADDK